MTVAFHSESSECPSKRCTYSAVLVVTWLLPINMGMPQYKAFGCVRRDPFTLAMEVKEGNSDSSEKEKKKKKKKRVTFLFPSPVLTLV